MTSYIVVFRRKRYVSRRDCSAVGGGSVSLCNVETLACFPQRKRKLDLPFSTPFRSDSTSLSTVFPYCVRFLCKRNIGLENCTFSSAKSFHENSPKDGDLLLSHFECSCHLFISWNTHTLHLNGGQWGCCKWLFFEMWRWLSNNSLFNACFFISLCQHILHAVASIGQTNLLGKNY